MPTDDKKFMPKKFMPLPRNMTKEMFVGKFGGVYEHSPWIAEAVWRRGLLPQHDTPAGMSAAMADVLAAAPRKESLALILAHPDLAGRAAVAGALTKESASEQHGAGIDQCSREEFERFQRFNKEYREKFGFPFIIAVKGKDRHAILQAFEQRLQNEEEQEYRQALAEINKIAYFRLIALADEMGMAE